MEGWPYIWEYPIVKNDFLLLPYFQEITTTILLNVIVMV